MNIGPNALVLGRSCFKDKIQAMIQRQARLGIPERPRIEEGNGGGIASIS